MRPTNIYFYALKAATFIPLLTIFLLSELFARGMNVRNKNQQNPIKDQNQFTFPGVDGALRRKSAFTKKFGHRAKGFEKSPQRNRIHSIHYWQIWNSGASRPRIQPQRRSHKEFNQIFSSGTRIQTISTTFWSHISDHHRCSAVLCVFCPI